MRKLHRGRRSLTYANVVSTICLFVVLGGAAYGAARVALPRNSVGARQLRRGAVRTGKIRNGAVTGKKINLASLGTVPSAARAESAATADRATTANSATTADRATSADSAGTATYATEADRAKAAVHAETADQATTAREAADAERLGGRPAAEYQMKLLSSCPNAAIQSIAQDGSVSCRDLVLPIMLTPSAGDPVSAVQLGPGLLFQTVCHDGGQVEVLFDDNGAIPASLNWLSSDGTTVSASGTTISAGSAKAFAFNGGRIEGQFIYSIGVNVTTVNLHALDATTSCEVRGTATLAAPAAG